MRRVRRTSSTWAPIVIDGARLQAREPGTLYGTLVLPDGRECGAACMRCPTQPCRTSGMAPGGAAGDLCPVDALEAASEDGSILVGPGCIACGICAVRCPLGALSMGSDGRYVGHPTSLLPNAAETTTPEGFAEWLVVAREGASMSRAERTTFVEIAMRAAAPLLGRHFYPLVESLFRAIGVPATVSNQGDTSNRIDLILTDPVDQIPVEVKSRTEVETINVKSVHQALENKLTISRLMGRADLSPSSSLVVGYQYPPSRSGIAELIDDIETAFGVRIGLVSLRRLYELLLAVNLDGATFDRDVLASLKGPL